MKALLLVITAFVSLNSFASEDCTTKAIKAAYNKALPAKEGFSAEVYSVETGSEGAVLSYKVGILVSYSDGASSDEFPLNFYEVLATGTEAKCRIISVKN